MNYAIFGAGAIGTLVGARLARAGFAVSLVGRKRHVEAIRKNGVEIRGVDPVPSQAVHAVETLDEVSLSADSIVLLTMKTQATRPALHAERERLRDVPLICFQNGVHNERIIDEFGLRGYGGLVDCSTQFLEPGIVTQAGPGHYGIGSLPLGSDALCERVAADLRGAGFAGRVFENVMERKWFKLLTNLTSAYLAVTDLARAEAMRSAEHRAFMADLLSEGVQVLRAAGVSYEAGENRPSMESSIATLRETPPPPKPDSGRRAGPAGRPSVWQDLKLQRGSVEIEYTNGEIVRLGEKSGVPTPLNRVLLARCEQMARERTFPGGVEPRELRAAAQSGAR